MRVSAELRPQIPGAFRAARTSLGLKQEELADYLGSSQDAISRWERGIDNPPMAALIALTELLPEANQAWWREITGVAGSGPVQTPEEGKLVWIPLLHDSVAAGLGRSVREREIDRWVPFLRELMPQGEKLMALRVMGDSMSPIVNDGYIVVIDASQQDAKKLEGKMVAAREGECVTIKWLRRDGKAFLLVPQHTAPEFPVRVMTEEGDFSIVGVVLKWIGYPPPARK